MRRFTMLGVLVAVTALGVSGADDKKGAIEGKWKFTAVVSNSNDTMIENGFLLTFDKDAAWLNDQKERFKYKVDTNAKPALLDVTTPDGKEMEGIWDVKGDVLRICVCSPEGVKFRPTEFHGRDNQILLTLQRVKD